MTTKSKRNAKLLVQSAATNSSGTGAGTGAGIGITNDISGAASSSNKSQSSMESLHLTDGAGFSIGNIISLYRIISYHIMWCDALSLLCVVCYGAT
jgi:hypothetical protein